jgi:hypothetical protein
LKIEAEKGFRRTLFEPELVDPNVEINFVKNLMGSLLLNESRGIKLLDHRKGNSLNHTIHVHKENEVTHDVDSTIFLYKRRNVCFTSMDTLKFNLRKHFIRSVRLKPWIKMHLSAFYLNGVLKKGASKIVNKILAFFSRQRKRTQAFLLIHFVLITATGL